MPRTVLTAAGLALAMTLANPRGLASAAEPLPAPTDGPAPATRATVGTAGTLRLNVKSYRPNEVVRLQVGDGQGRYAPVCTAPCSADVVPGTPLRVTLGDAEEAHEFEMAGSPGNEMDVEVRPASKGALVGGIVMTSIGGLVATIGLLLVATSHSSGVLRSDGLETAGWVTTLAGAGITVGGVVLIAGRSKEPRIRQDEHARKAPEPQSSRPIASDSPAPVVTPHTRTADLYASDATTRSATVAPPSQGGFTVRVHF